MKWISVLDTLPEYEVDVLVTDGTRRLISNIVSIERTKSQTIINWVEPHIETQTERGFTHWIPLPELPDVIE